MKIKLSVNQVPYSGFLNFDPVPVIEDGKEYNVSSSDFRELNEVSTSSVLEMICDDVIDYIPRPHLSQTLGLWVSKLRHTGKIHISGTDIYEVCRLFLTGMINNDEYNQIVHGSAQHPWDLKLSQSTLNEVADILISHGLKITTKNLEGTRFFIEGIRE